MAHSHLKVVVPAFSRPEAVVAADRLLDVVRFPNRHWEEHFEQCDCWDGAQFEEVDVCDLGMPFTDPQAARVLTEGVVSDLLIVTSLPWFWRSFGPLLHGRMSTPRDIACRLGIDIVGSGDRPRRHTLPSELARKIASSPATWWLVSADGNI